MKVILISGHARCVDGETEFFNGIQWKPISEYQHGDKVLQYNVDKTATLIDPINYIKEPCEYLWHFNNTKLDQCLSEDHQVYYITSKNNLYHKSFKEVMQGHQSSKEGFGGKFITTFKFGSAGINLTIPQIKLMCAVICDSTIVEKKGICYLNIKKERKKIELRKILLENQIEYQEKQFDSMEGYSRFIFKPPILTKEFSNEWYNCTYEQFETICDNIIKWDGYIKNKNSFSYSTTNKKNADFIQFVFTTCGYRSNIIIEDRTNQKYLTNNKFYLRKSIEYQVSGTKNILVSIFNRDYNNTNNFFKKYKTIDGYCYCFMVDSGMLVLRRNNKIFITGNCGKDSTADILKKHFDQIGKKTLITHYADLVKYVCKTFFEWNGEKDEYGRSLLMRVGTDEIRATYPDFWVKFICDIISIYNHKWDYVMIPDCRFPNEIEYVKARGFDVKTIRVNRLNYLSLLTEEQQKHSSETSLDNYEFDYIVNSESGLDKLEKEIHKIEGEL